MKNLSSYILPFSQISFPQCADGESNRIVEDMEKLLQHESLTLIELETNQYQILQIKKILKNEKIKIAG